LYVSDGGGNYKKEEKRGSEEGIAIGPESIPASVGLLDDVVVFEVTGGSRAPSSASDNTNFWGWWDVSSVFSPTMFISSMRNLAAESVPASLE
jgi:hypothetical protein